MKYGFRVKDIAGAMVASLAEAWIEIFAQIVEFVAQDGVASLAEAWIEIAKQRAGSQRTRSPPSRRRGLKSSVKTLLLMTCRSPPSRRRGLKYQ